MTGMQHSAIKSPWLHMYPAWLLRTLRFMCWMMIVWNLTMATWLGAFIPAWSDMLAKVTPWQISPMAKDIMSKYKSQPAIALLHQIPSAIWSAGILNQLDHGSRARNPWLHRLSGYVVFASSFALVAGVGLMHKRRLIDDLTTNAPGYGLGMAAQSLWFVSTAVVAAYAARARDFQTHQAWVLRHLGAGMFVVVQRWLMGFLTLLGALQVVDWSQSEELRSRWFRYCGEGGFVICFVTAEAVLRAHRMRIKAARAEPQQVSRMHKQD